MGVDRSSLSSPGAARSAARTTGDGLAVVRQQPTSPGNHCDQIDDFGSCNLDSIHQGGTIFERPTCFVRRQERMIMSPIFSSGEPGPQLTWTAMYLYRVDIRTAQKLGSLFKIQSTIPELLLPEFKKN